MPTTTGVPGLTTALWPRVGGASPLVSVAHRTVMLRIPYQLRWMVGERECATSCARKLAGARASACLG
eukprot:2260209-Pyramimonas_sp.AAC.1